MLSTNRSYRIKIFDISLVLLAICLRCSATIRIPANESNGFEFDPPSEWQTYQLDNATGKRTNYTGTNVTFTFQGKSFLNAYLQPTYDLTPVLLQTASSIAVYADWTQFKANVSASINDSGIPFLEPKQSTSDQPVKIFETTKLHPDETHTIRISRRNEATEENPWNILYIE